MIRTLTWMMLGVGVLFVLTLIGLADAGRGRELFLLAAYIPAGDKVGHLVLFGMLAFLANVSLNGSRLHFGFFTVLKGSLFVLIPTVLEEFSQLCFRSRTFDLLDIAADVLGVLLGGWFSVMLLRLLRLPSRRLQELPPQAGAVISSTLQGD